MPKFACLYVALWGIAPLIVGIAPSEPQTQTVSANAQSQLPDFVAERLVARSIEIQRSRSNRTAFRNLRSEHHVWCDDENLALDLRTWAERAGFEVEPPLEVLDHGGQPFFRLILIARSQVAVRPVHAQAAQIVGRLAGLSGARYADWRSELER